MRALGVGDPGEVLARGVRVLDRALAARSQGERIFIKTRSGSEEEIL